VNHFLGDAVMALFNLPIKHDDHVRRAVEAAFRIEEAANDINSTLRGDFVFGVGIGIATGLALATKWARPIVTITLSSAMRSISLHGCKRKRLVAKFNVSIK
jgi:Adenylate and Guanylate cyclase catalytic domain